MNANNKKYVLIDNEEKYWEALTHLDNVEYVAYDTETTGLNVRKEKVIGFSFTGKVKEGYYLSERGNLQVWYPLNLFENDKQRMDVIWEDGTEETVNYTRIQALLINSIFDFEFIGDL